MVVNGLDSMKTRADESVRVMEWAFRNFDLKTVFAKGQEAARVPVWLGDRADVAAVAAQDVKALMPRIGAGQVGVNLLLDAPVAAPVKQGDPLGMVEITLPDGKKQEVALVAGETVERLGFFGRIAARLSHLIGAGDGAELTLPVAPADVAAPSTGSAQPAAAQPMAEEAEAPAPVASSVPAAVEEAEPAPAPAPAVTSPADAAPATME
jgi:hypothetical protein